MHSPCSWSIVTREAMVLKYDQFGMRVIEVTVLAWPGFQYGFQTGELSQLYAALNGTDTFDSVQLRGTLGARFDGEAWTMEIDQTNIRLRCTNFLGADELRAKASELLAQTRKFFAEQKQPLVFAPLQIFVMGHVPGGNETDVGETLKKKLLPKLRADLNVVPPGLTGAGLRLVGDTDEFHWHASIEPIHGDYGMLGLTSQLYFELTDEPPRPGDDIQAVANAIEASYVFLTEHIRPYSSAVFK